MKLEYLPDGSPDCPLIRLFGFTSGEVAQLRAFVADLAQGRVESVAVHELPFVESIGGCQLVLRVWPRDQSVLRVGEPAMFECRLTRITWDNVEGLMEPFAHGTQGYQWLAEHGDASLLISASGQW